MRAESASRLHDHEHDCMRHACLSICACVSIRLQFIPHRSSHIDPHHTMAHLFKDASTYERFKRSYDAIADTSANANMNIVSHYDCMMECMKSSGQVQELLLPPHVLGVHPANRGGKMMSASAFMARGARIVQVGTSKQSCGPSRCVAMEDAPTSTATYDRMLATSATSSMFSRPSKNTRYGTLGGSHLNEFLKAINDMCPTNESCLQRAAIDPGVSSCIDKDRLFHEDPVLADICTHGLRWSIIHHAMGTTFPMLASMVQKALNTEHHIGQGETWEQVLYQAAKLAASHVKQSKEGIPDIEWSSVKTAILKSCPTCSYDLQRRSIIMDIVTRGHISNTIAKSYRISLVFNLISYRLFHLIAYRFDSHHVRCSYDRPAVYPT